MLTTAYSHPAEDTIKQYPILGCAAYTDFSIRLKTAIWATHFGGAFIATCIRARITHPQCVYIAYRRINQKQHARIHAKVERRESSVCHLKRQRAIAF